VCACCATRWDDAGCVLVVQPDSSPRLKENNFMTSASAFGAAEWSLLVN
jgi:hypothetical protein